MSDNPDRDKMQKLPPPQLNTIQFASAWNIATPAVYRYEDQVWIDHFFQTGSLRLSTFAKFASYEDEVRGDKNEGAGICFGETKDNHTVVVAQSQGFSAAVFCCSHRLDVELKKSFQRNSAFQITNTVGFALEISRQLAGFKFGIEGSCIYRSDANIKRNIDFNMGDYKLDSGGFDMQMISDAAKQLGGPELVLLKRKNYENQQEYRLIWELDVVDTEFIEVNAPRARQFCRELLAYDWN